MSIADALGATGLLAAILGVIVAFLSDTLTDSYKSEAVVKWTGVVIGLIGFVTIIVSVWVSALGVG